MWGIWNGVTKRFVFGIKETSEERALHAFNKVGGKLSYRWRYEARRIPHNWINPKNPLWRNER